jgi:phosphate:Na+ symporter
MAFILISLFGGLGLFLLGMGMLTDGLKVAAGPALRDLLHRWTRTAARGLLAGILITALVQSSSAVTVATVGFVNAGLLTMTQAVWVVFGTNVGTTMTAWLVALVGVKIDMPLLALPLVGLGMFLQLLLGNQPRLAGLGRAIAGFGLFFMGVGVLQGAFTDLGGMLPAPAGEISSVGGLLLFVALGAVITTLTQSSSAAIAIVLTAVAGGTVGLVPAAAVVIGANIGTTSTAVFAALRATPAARRVVVAQIAFNVVTALAAILLIRPLLSASVWLADRVAEAPSDALVLAFFHSLFNLVGVLLMVPLAPPLVRRLERLFRRGELLEGRPLHLDQTLLEVPSIAVHGLALEVATLAERQLAIARAQLRQPDRLAALRVREATAALGEAIRDFVSQLSSRDLPPDGVDALADLIRALQHLEELPAHFEDLDPGALRADAGEEHLHLREAADVLLAADLGDTGPDAERFEAVRAAYQQAKARLLHRTAAGQMPPHALELALADARAVRRIADSALKARRRLRPWLEDPGPETIAEAPPAVAESAQPVP